MSDYPNEVDDFEAARLVRNAKLYSYDRILDAAADLFDRDPLAWAQLPVFLQDRSGLYRDARETYRRAVAAGLIPDDRSPSAA